MNISDIANYIWINSVEYSFGGKSDWLENLFLADWAKTQGIQDQWREMKEGWYWFCAKTTYSDLRDLKKPSSLPAKGCDIGLITHENEGVFGEELLCHPSKEGWLPIYNGHEKNIKERVRAHFALSSDRTGALGICHYSVSGWQWKVRMFSVGQIDPGGNPELLRQIRLLIKSKSGRCSVESAWRVSNGWPVLCKE